MKKISDFCGNVFASMCFECLSFNTRCFQLRPVKVQRVILPSARNRSQLVGIKSAHNGPPNFTLSLHVFVFVNL